MSECVSVSERVCVRVCCCACRASPSQDAPLRTAGATPALKLTPHALNMFRTYLRESSPEYVKYSGVRLPEDHSEHAVFELIDKAAREEAGAP